MPKESFLDGKMDRRKFLKTAATTAGAILIGGKEAETQGRKPLDNLVEDLVTSSTLGRINYPDEFREIPEEAEELLLEIKIYLNLIFRGEISSRGLATGSAQNMPLAADNNELRIGREKLWGIFNKIGLASTAFLDENFYRVLIMNVPRYLAGYGIYVRPSALEAKRNDSRGNPIAFERVEALLQFYKINRIEPVTFKQDGSPDVRNILIIREPLAIKGVLMNGDDGSRLAETVHKNIILFEKNLESELKKLIETREDYRKVPNLLQVKTMDLQRMDSWDVAVIVALLKVSQKLEIPSYEEYRMSILSHEQQHLAEQDSLNLKSLWPVPENASISDIDRIAINVRIHGEINPILSELRFGPKKDLVLFNYLGGATNLSETAEGAYSWAKKWIFRRMIELISKDPKRYGVKIESNSIRVENQILSQLNVLLDKPDLIDELCDKILDYHNKNLREDVREEIARPLQITESENSNFAFRVGVPIAIGGGALALEALRRRKKKIAAEQAKLKGMSRTERREYERKKKKGKS